MVPLSKLRRSIRFAPCSLALAALLTIAGCATPPTAAPTARDIRGLKPSGAVTMSQVFLSGAGVGSGTLTFQGRAYPFTLIGSVTGIGALSGLNATGEVYNLRDLSQFSGAWFQGAGPLAVSPSGRGDLWLKNNHGVVMRLSGVQTGLTLTTGRYQLFIDLAK
jgi:hypothetical protein